MAIAAKKIEIAKDGDATVGCVTDIVVDTEEGIVAEKKTFAVSVPDGKGGTNCCLWTNYSSYKDCKCCS